MKEKLKTLHDSVQLIKDDDTVAIGWQTPMAIIREIVKQKKRDLTIYCMVGGIEVDMLCGAGCVKEIHAIFVALYTAAGMVPPNFRRSVQNGTVRMIDECELPLGFGIKAGALNLPFIPLRGFRSEITKFHPQWKTVKSPIADEDILIIPPILPDVAIHHWPRGDVNGNIHADSPLVYDATMAWWDRQIAMASRKVIVSVEKVVDTDEIRKQPDKTLLPFYNVDAVIEAPKGGHPCAIPGYYEEDTAHIHMYTDACRDESSFKAYLDKYVYGAKDHNDYLSILAIK